jgi:hypothetical protein
MLPQPGRNHDADAVRTKSALDALRRREDFRLLFFDAAFPANCFAGESSHRDPG